MQQLIERMLQLARLESGQGLDRQSVEPARLGRRVLDARQIQAQRRQIALHAELGKVSRSGIPCWWSRPLATCWTTPPISPPIGSTLVLSGHGGGGYCFRSAIGARHSRLCAAQDFRAFLPLPRPDKGKAALASFAMEVARQHGGHLAFANQPDGVLATLWLPGN